MSRVDDARRGPGCASGSPTSWRGAASTPTTSTAAGFVTQPPTTDRLMLTVVDPDRLRRVLVEVLDEDGMLSPHGIRSLSQAAPGRAVLGARWTGRRFSVGYEPAESTERTCTAATPTGAGRCGSRSTTWSIEALQRYDQLPRRRRSRSSCPTGSGRQARRSARSPHELRERLVGAVPAGPGRAPAGRRPTAASAPTRAGTRAAVLRVLRRRRRRAASAPRTRPAGPVWSPTSSAASRCRRSPPSDPALARTGAVPGCARDQ